MCYNFYYHFTTRLCHSLYSTQLVHVTSLRSGNMGWAKRLHLLDFCLLLPNEYKLKSQQILLIVKVYKTIIASRLTGATFSLPKGSQTCPSLSLGKRSSHRLTFTKSKIKQRGLLLRTKSPSYYLICSLFPSIED